MALSLTNFTNAKAAYMAAIPKDDAASFRTAYEFFSWLSQMQGNPDLQVVSTDYLTGTDVVIADAACKVYMILLKKNNTTVAIFKADDSASAVTNAGATLMSFRQNTAEVDQKFFPKGLALASGLTVCSDTTPTGSTGSTAGDGAKLTVLLGGA